nr:M14 metal carboxypeptidase 16 [Antheraea yamamai]
MIQISNGNPNNKGVLVTSGVHSREWIAITSGLYILNSIVTNFDHLQHYITNKDWYIIPMVNPDGYLYSYTKDRLWRKNRRKTGRCIGIDINRNFEKYWGVKGITEYNQCGESYVGSHPFSEKESIALRDIVLKYKNRLDAIVDLHSFGQLIMFPWSADSQPTYDAELHKDVAKGMSKAIYRTTKLNFKYGAVYHIIYPASGSLVDWTYASGVKLSYGIEGRDLGHHGFLIPPDHIEDAGKEMLSAVSHLAKILEPNLIRKGTNNNSWF